MGKEKIASPSEIKEKARKHYRRGFLFFFIGAAFVGLSFFFFPLWIVILAAAVPTLLAFREYSVGKSLESKLPNKESDVKSPDKKVEKPSPQLKPAVDKSHSPSVKPLKPAPVVPEKPSAKKAPTAEIKPRISERPTRDASQRQTGAERVNAWLSGPSAPTIPKKISDKNLKPYSPDFSSRRTETQRVTPPSHTPVLNNNTYPKKKVHWAEELVSYNEENNTSLHPISSTTPSYDTAHATPFSSHPWVNTPPPSPASVPENEITDDRSIDNIDGLYIPGIGTVMAVPGEQAELLIVGTRVKIEGCRSAEGNTPYSLYRPNRNSQQALDQLEVLLSSPPEPLQLIGRSNGEIIFIDLPGTRTTDHWPVPPAVPASVPLDTTRDGRTPADRLDGVTYFYNIGIAVSDQDLIVMRTNPNMPDVTEKFITGDRITTVAGDSSERSAEEIYGNLWALDQHITDRSRAHAIARIEVSRQPLRERENNDDDILSVITEETEPDTLDVSIDATQPAVNASPLYPERTPSTETLLPDEMVQKFNELDERPERLNRGIQEHTLENAVSNAVSDGEERGIKTAADIANQRRRFHTAVHTAANGLTGAFQGIIISANSIPQESQSIPLSTPLPNLEAPHNNVDDADQGELHHIGADELDESIRQAQGEYQKLQEELDRLRLSPEQEEASEAVPTTLQNTPHDNTTPPDLTTTENPVHENHSAGQKSPPVYQGLFSASDEELMAFRQAMEDRKKRTDAMFAESRASYASMEEELQKLIVRAGNVSVALLGINHGLLKDPEHHPLITNTSPDNSLLGSNISPSASIPQPFQSQGNNTSLSSPLSHSATIHNVGTAKQEVPDSKRIENFLKERESYFSRYPTKDQIKTQDDVSKELSELTNMVSKLVTDPTAPMETNHSIPVNLEMTERDVLEELSRLTQVLASIPTPHDPLENEMSRSGTPSGTFSEDDNRSELSDMESDDLSGTDDLLVTWEDEPPFDPSLAEAALRLSSTLTRNLNSSLSSSDEEDEEQSPSHFSDDIRARRRDNSLSTVRS